MKREDQRREEAYNCNIGVLMKSILLHDISLHGLLPEWYVADQRNAQHSHICNKLGAIKTYPMVTLVTLQYLYQKA